MPITRSYVESVPPMVSPFITRWGFAMEWITPTASASGTYESANRGVWFPCYVPTVCIAKRMFWVNGATVNGNIEAGIYLDAGYKPGDKLVTSGSVAQATTNTVQFGDITDTTLTPQLYWLYLSSSSATNTIFRSVITAASGVTSSHKELLGFEQASIGPGSAPTTATPVERTGENLYFFGFSTTTIT